MSLIKPTFPHKHIYKCKHECRTILAAFGSNENETNLKAVHGQVKSLLDLSSNLLICPAQPHFKKSRIYSINITHFLQNLSVPWLVLRYGIAVFPFHTH